MAQHFLLSAAARSLSLAKVMRMTEDQAFDAFRSIRWADTQGDAVCPRCGCFECYTYTARRIFKCKGCGSQFSVTSGTIFASRKMDLRDILAAIAIFVNGAKGHSALQLSRDLDCQYKTAFVLSHKIREALAAEQRASKLEGTVEVDGAYFGGYVKPANRREDRADRRRKVHQSGKRQVVVVARERDGETLTHVAKTEAEGVPFVLGNVEPGATLHADEAGHWDHLEARYLTKRINHSEAYSTPEACTNMAESFFSRLRRAEVGTHHHIAGRYLGAYASEMAWREDNRRISNGEQFLLATSSALAHPVSRQWKGYWQRG
ncbi:IS1595 family transposase [Phenylobacterium sp. J426]|uniref:IS1595 family transposase n=1 Tax=Phenylobacterium sp. J426 TaxID=2898439 RepID=UPI0021516B35|nr:IS1595 family transposase [Phenylobacterium sp. J426]MCR5873966.1 IS1595 family transposase [Phenylobacterium sp. J426]MCR5874255.1 IS1595 family transposase [Phenylobacterium sp. J426]